MDPATIHADTRRRFLEIVEDADLPEPDEIEHDGRVIVFRWFDRRLAVEVDLSDAPGMANC